MTLTRTRRTALIFGAVCAVIAGTVFVVSQASRSTFPGTDVEYFSATSESDSEDCGHYAGDLESLVKGTQLIVLATVTSEQPLFEGVYGTDLPQEVDGELPARRGDYLPRRLQLDIEQVLSGSVPETLDVRGEGWVARNDSDTWHRHIMYGSPFLNVGERAVVPMYRMADYPSGQPIYAVSCTGAFVIDDGEVQPRDHGLEFKDDGVYSMTEQELVAAIQKLAG
ncbi:hypothetical protein ACVBEQ_08245 [Nakamurella sp. GG22]